MKTQAGTVRERRLTQPLKAMVLDVSLIIQRMSCTPPSPCRTCHRTHCGPGAVSAGVHDTIIQQQTILLAMTAITHTLNDDTRTSLLV